MTGCWPADQRVRTTRRRSWNSFATRRQFMNQSAGVMSLGSLAPGLWRRAAAAAEPRRDATILVVLELTGGNDGLNTVVPHADDVYHKSRPTLRVEPGKVLKLDDRVGLHPALKDLHQVWENGDLAVVQGVGYPNPNRSHFRSMEIWQTGTIGPAPPAGWLGRLGDAHPGWSSATWGRGPCRWRCRGGRSSPSRWRASPTTGSWPEAEFPSRFAGRCRRRSARSKRFAAATRRPWSWLARLERLRRRTGVKADPDTLEGRLESIRRLIEADTPYRVFYTSQDGFDTHAGQLFAHQELLRTLGKAVSGFLEQLKASKLDERVVVLIFSEFGRRLKENANRGTDHGTAAPVLIAGSP